LQTSLEQFNNLKAEGEEQLIHVITRLCCGSINPIFFEIPSTENISICKHRITVYISMFTKKKEKKKEKEKTAEKNLAFGFRH
jgi:hypothetical protein